MINPASGAVALGSPAPASPTMDATLTAWLDAARAGGLPEPSRADRWQPLRAGATGLWEFEAAEYWYANGWVQLMGRNETGKSSLMALTTLIPWLADTSSANIDTLGRSGKRFRYYVEPTGADGDRRSIEASTNRGWLWVEYGRRAAEGARYFTTLLFAETRTASPAVNLVWCTAEDARVREALRLAPGRIVAHPKEVRVSGFVAHGSAALYKQEVARRLLGASVDRLEAAGKMLRVTRTPKLGAELQVGFVTEHLRSALPELERHEVDALAAGWDSLDQIRADVTATQLARDVVERFRRASWLPWVSAELRLRADAATRARTEFDRVTREERAALDAVEAQTATQGRVESALAAARDAANAARTAADELQNSARYADARERVATLEQRRREAEALARAQRQHAEDAEREAAAEARAEAELAQRAARLDEASHQVELARDNLTRTASEARVLVSSGEVDLPLFDQRLRERRASIGLARKLLSAFTRADASATQGEDRASEANERAANDGAQARDAWASAASAREALMGDLARWSASVEPEPPTPQVDAWVAGLPYGVDADGRVPGAPLRDLVQESWLAPAQRKWVVRQRDASVRRADAEESVAALSTQIDELAGQSAPVFAAPVGWARRTRPAASQEGAPLWSLLDPRDGHATGLAQVEAALAAMGLLDAWVAADGVHLVDRNGADTVLAVSVAVDAPEREEDGERGTISALLASVGPEALARQASALLRAIPLIGPDDAPLADDLPPDGLAVAADGRWRSGVLTGKADPIGAEAEWIGERARAARRRRLIEALVAQREDSQAAAERAASDEAEATAALTGLDESFRRCPADEPLRARLILAAEREDVAERSAVAARRADEAAREARASADKALATLIDHCADADLPHDDPGLLAADTRVTNAERSADRYRGAQVAHQHATEAHADASGRLGERRGHLMALRRRLAETNRQVADAAATVATLEATLDADDSAVLAELDRLRAEEKLRTAEREHLEVTLRNLGVDLARAQATLENAERRREEATGERDAAYARFRARVDRGLAGEAGVELPDPLATAVDKVRDQVAAARRLLTVRDWPEDPDTQEVHVHRLESRLTEAAHEIRQQLEAGGRSLRIVSDVDGMPRVEVLVDSAGAGLAPREASARLAQVLGELQSQYTERVQAILDELLGSTFLEHLRDRLGATDALAARINRVLAAHPVVTTQTSLRIVLEAGSDADKLMLDAVRGASLANPGVAAQVREHLRSRVEDAKRTALAQGEVDWRARLADALDYRRWFGVHLQKKVGASGSWSPLTSQTFAELSGGARAVILMLPLVATLAALYEDMREGPRPLWLDEAFDGLDSANRSMVLDLFRSFDLDVLLAGPNRLVNVKAVPAAAIYQVVRAPSPMPGADLTLELWAGGDLVVVDLPTSMSDADGGGSASGLAESGEPDGADVQAALL